ncbi:MAG TPA: hypothetical protein VJ992_11120 [Gemmatimonadales bacterium]|nr:hypothetical protein [Gemmatimonadales bacterium]
MHQVVHDTSSNARGSWFRLAVRLAGRAALRPRLALALMSAVWVFRARGWYRRPPFLPLPDRTYLRWRMYTAYGDEAAVPPIEDVERFVRWRRAFFRR